jgi:hypothetical protein
MYILVYMCVHTCHIYLYILIYTASYISIYANIHIYTNSVLTPVIPQVILYTLHTNKLSLYTSIYVSANLYIPQVSTMQLVACYSLLMRCQYNLRIIAGAVYVHLDAGARRQQWYETFVPVEQVN